MHRCLEWSCRIVVMMYILTNHFICCDYRKSWRYSFWNIQWHQGFAFNLLNIEIVNLIPLRWFLFKFISSMESQTTCDPHTCKAGFVLRNSTFLARPPTKREQKPCPALKRSNIITFWGTNSPIDAAVHVKVVVLSIEISPSPTCPCAQPKEKNNNHCLVLKALSKLPLIKVQAIQ